MWKPSGGRSSDGRHPAGIVRNVWRRYAVPWAAEAGVRGDHEAREPHFGRDGDRGGKVEVVPDSREERVIRDDHCHHAVGVVAGPYGREIGRAHV